MCVCVHHTYPELDLYYKYYITNDNRTFRHYVRLATMTGAFEDNNNLNNDLSLSYLDEMIDYGEGQRRMFLTFQHNTGNSMSHQKGF